ncbi:hypothetical protein BUY84_13100 [Staphylococcus equorum]|nr:hypothetical protein BUY84_13100 [Staphylococcus equorum]
MIKITNAKEAMLPMNFFNIIFQIKYEVNVKRATKKAVFSNIEPPYRDSRGNRSINNTIVKQPKMLPTIARFFNFSIFAFSQSLIYLLFEVGFLSNFLNLKTCT